MIIDDFDIESIAIAPDEAHPPLVVDANAVLAAAIAAQRLQPVAGWRPEIVEAARVVHLDQFPFADAQHVLRHALDDAPLPRRARGFVAERPDHTPI